MSAGTFRFAAPRRTRRPSLTPMIDVVFLLLVFFMLAARFGQDAALVLTPPGFDAQAEWSGPPRLVTLDGAALRLNGVPVEAGALLQTLRPLMETPADPVLLRAEPGTPVQALVDLLERLGAAGLTGPVLVE